MGFVIIAVLASMMPAQAHAIPLIASAVTAIFGVGAAAATTIATVLGIGLAIGGQLLLAGRNGKQKTQEQQFDLARDTGLPDYRVVYGETLAMGTPTGIAVNDSILTGCWILSSRESHGDFTVYFDKRPLTLSGDPYDFNGAGATVTNAPFDSLAKLWIGRGDQTTAPAALVSEFPADYLSTDAWKGRTVMWLRLDCGDNEKRSERWPAGRPEVMVHGKWTKVWDPREPGQSAADPATWTWSANHGLCILDAMMNNPIEPYTEQQIWMETLIWAADVADEATAVAGGGTIPRYEINGTLVYSSEAEMEDQIQPLLEAGAARFTRARGQLGVIAGAPVDVTMVLTDMLDSSAANFTRYQPSSAIYDAVQATYSAPDRYLEDSSLPLYTVPGEAGKRVLKPSLKFVTDYRQGERVQKIMLMRTRMQKQIAAEFPPISLNLVSGSVVTTDFEAPFSPWDGTWEVETSDPQLFAETDKNGDPTGGVFGRCGLSLREYSNAIFAWDADTEEVAVAQYDFDAETPAVAPPDDVDVYMDDSNDTTESGVVVPRFRCEFSPSPSGSVDKHEWQIRLDGAGWPAEINALADSDADPTIMYGGILSQTELQDFRIRANGNRGPSGWVIVPGLSRSFILVSVTVTGGVGEVDVAATAPANAVFFGWQVRRGAVFASAAVIHEQYGLQPQAALSATIGGEAAGTYDYWVVPVSQSYTLGTPSGPFTRTIS